MTEHSFERAGKKIVYRTWTDVKFPRGIIQIAHGMVEHTARYDEVAKRFNRAGFVVFADEHRGHGLTDSETLGYCKGEMYFSTVEDMHVLSLIAKDQYPALPLFLFGFSYGSFLTQTYIGKYMDELSGVIIGGSNKNPYPLVAFGKVVSSLACLFVGETAKAKFVKKLTFDSYDSHFEDKCFLSTNKESNEKYFADSFCTYTCSYNFYRSFFGGMMKLYSRKYKKALRKDVPILLISGEQDPVGDMSKGVKRLYDFYKSASCNVYMKLYENSRHEFLNEDVTRTNDIVAFIESTLDQ